MAPIVDHRLAREIRRGNMSGVMIFAFGEFVWDANHSTLWRDGKIVKADALVLRLLDYLVRHPGALISKDDLARDVWDERAVADNAITVSIARLRKLLGHEHDRSWLQTVYGRGYRFSAPVEIRHDGPGAQVGSLSSGDEPPFVGRERALAQLRAALRNARSGRGRICVLSGEPGIGKTRCVDMLERELANDIETAWCFGRESGDTPPLAPWMQLLHSLSTRNGARKPERAGLLHDAEAALQALCDADPSLDEPSAERIARRRLQRERAFETVCRALASVARDSCQVWVLDDLHRFDPASLELLDRLMGEISRMRLLLIATMRPLEVEHHALPRIVGHRNCERMSLERLSEDDVARYVAALMDDPAEELGRAVFRKSEGNPFFMSELARQLCDLEHPDARSLAVPDGALELIRQRIARLDPVSVRVLSSAAVIGRSFELPMLQALSDCEPNQLIEHLDAAIAMQVIVAAPGSRTAFAFGHQLLRDVLYAGLTPAERRKQHVRMAEALEERAARGEIVHAAEIAHHFHSGLPESDLRKTVKACRAAAAEAAAVSAGVDVVHYVRQALEALALMTQPSIRLRASLLYMLAFYSRGHAPAQYLKVVSELGQLAREQKLGPMLIRIGCVLNLYPGFKPLPGATLALEQGLELLDEFGAGPRAAALAALAFNAPAVYSEERARELIGEATRLARADQDQKSLYTVLMSRLYLEGGPVHDATIDEVTRELEQMAQRDSTRMRLFPVDMAVHLAVRGLQRGEPVAMRHAIERSITSSAELQHGELRWHSERFAAIAEINRGRVQAGLSALRDLHTRAERQGILGSEPFCAFDRCVIFSELEGRGDAVSLHALGFDPSDPPSIWSMKIRALSAIGATDLAKSSLGAVAPAALARLPCDRDWLGTLGHLTRAALAFDLPDYLDALYIELSRHETRFAGHISFFSEGAVPQLLGMLAERAGRIDQAIAQLELGVRMNERAGLQLRAAEAKLHLSRCLRSGDTTRSDRLAKEAEASAAEMGLPRMAAEAQLVEASRP